MSGPPTNSPRVNCQPSSGAMITPSSMTRLVEASWKAIAEVKSAPLRNRERPTPRRRRSTTTRLHLARLRSRASGPNRQGAGDASVLWTPLPGPPQRGRPPVSAPTGSPSPYQRRSSARQRATPRSTASESNRATRRAELATPARPHATHPIPAWPASTRAAQTCGCGRSGGCTLARSNSGVNARRRLPSPLPSGAAQRQDDEQDADDERHRPDE